jgi:hypothetical protein
MTGLILFHHAQGLTDGVRAFADELRAAGHVVHVYPGARHLLTDSSLAEYEEGAATLLGQRVRAFLADLG